jgi:hypothetical protein
MAASLAASPQLIKNGPLAGWTPEKEAPYVSFVTRGQFAGYRSEAKDIVCPASGDPGWRACEDKDVEQIEKLRSLAKDRVIVIGEDVAGVDRHDTVVGELPGYLLQANYIESLLDNRLIRPVWGPLNVLAGLAFFGAFEYFARQYEKRNYTRWQVIKRVTILIVASCLTVYLSVTLLGYYLNPTTIGLLAVVLRLTDTFPAPPSEASKKEQS